MPKFTKAINIAIVIATVACSTPRYQSDVDRTLEGHSKSQLSFDAQQPPKLQPWTAGQWVLYRSRIGDSIGYERYSISIDQNCGIWLEHISQGYHRRTIEKICFKSMPDFSSLSSTEVLDLQQIVVSKRDDQPLVELDFRTERGQRIKTAMRSYWNGVSILGWNDLQTSTSGTIVVVAGRFLRARRIQRSPSASVRMTVWLHPTVPVTGVVRARSNRGFELELIAFGQN